MCNGNKMKACCKNNLEKIAQTQPATTMVYASATSYYQCNSCGTLYQEITLSDTAGRPTKSGIVKYSGKLTKEEITGHIPKMRGILHTEDVNKILEERK